MEQFSDLYIGCETGIIKGVDLVKQRWQNVATVHQADRQNEIVCMCWNDVDQNQLCVGRRNQSVSVFDTDSSTFVYTLNCTAGSGPFKGLCTFGSNLVTCTESGCMRVWQLSGSHSLEIKVGENICCMRRSPQQTHLLATAGRENPLKLWNLEHAEQPQFTSKNVRHDWLNLRVPEWFTDVNFLYNSSCVVASTNNHQVRVYDPSSNIRRPVLSVTFGECPITTVCVQLNADKHVFAGSAQGDLGLVDLRQPGRVVQLYKGAEGSIRSVACHSGQSVVAACGLDRFVRLYDINSRHLVHKFYLKSRLNCLLFTNKRQSSSVDANMPPTCSSVRKESVDDDDDEVMATNDDDQLWSSMADVISSHDRSRKRRRQCSSVTTKSCTTSDTRRKSHK